MANKVLSKEQRNQIVRALGRGPLDPGECELSYSSTGYTVTHVPSGSAITYGDFGLLETVISTVGTDPSRNSQVVSGFNDFVVQVSRWAVDVREWVETPDLWELARSGGAIPGELTPDSENTAFTADERAALSTQLKAIAQTVKETYDLTAEQSAELDEKFEEVAKASERVNRKDWGLLFGGAVLSLILADVFTPGVAGHVLLMLEHGVGHLFTGGTPAIGGLLSAGQE